MKKVFKTDYIILALSLFSFFYILLRAILLPGYHDEINSFFIYIQTGNFLPFTAPADQNNHVLNSLFAYLSFKAIGGKLIALRLANVLSYIVYLYYVWQIGKTFKSQNIAIAWFITMTCSLYFISFFSLSRGYGLSMAFLIAAFYHLLAYYKEYNNKNMLLGLLAGIMSVWSYLGVMIPVLITGSLFIGLAAWSLYTSRNTSSLKVLIPGTIILYIIPLLFAIKFSFFLKSQNDLFGSDSGGFIQAVVLKLVDEFAGTQPSISGRVILLLIFVTLMLSGFLIVKRKGLNNSSAHAHLLLWGTITGTIAMHFLLGIEYPKSRMSIYFYVLVMFALYSSVDESENKLAKYSSYFISGIIVIQFLYSFNFSYVPCWRYDTLPKSVYQKIVAETSKTGTIPTISTTEIIEVEYAFQNYENKGQLNVAQCTDFPGYYADFIISNDPTIINTIYDYDTILVDGMTHVSLLKRKKPVQWVEMRNFNKPIAEGENEFLPLAEKQDCVPFRNHPFCFEIRFKAQSDKFPFRPAIVCDVWDENNKSLRTNVIKLQNIHSDARNVTYFHKKLLFENIPAEAASLVFYCLNSDKRMVKLTDIDIKLFKGESN